MYRGILRSVIYRVNDLWSTVDHNRAPWWSAVILVQGGGDPSVRPDLLLLLQGILDGGEAGGDFGLARPKPFRLLQESAFLSFEMSEIG